MSGIAHDTVLRKNYNLLRIYRDMIMSNTVIFFFAIIGKQLCN